MNGGIFKTKEEVLFMGKINHTREPFKPGRYRAFFQLLIITFAVFSESVGIGMSAIVFPITMQSSGLDVAIIGIILSFDAFAALLVSLLFPRILRYIGIKGAVFIAGGLSVLLLLLLSVSSSLLIWAAGVFLYGLGSFMFVMLLQTWLNNIDIQERKGLVLALFNTAMSIGLALGPLFINFIKSTDAASFATVLDIFAFIGFPITGDAAVLGTRLIFYMAALFSAIAFLVFLTGFAIMPSIKMSSGKGMLSLILNTKGPMFAIMMAAVSVYGVTAFIAIYGSQNGLDLDESTVLLSSFLIGSLLLETPFTWLSDYFDRRFLIVLMAFACLICAVYLPIAITFNAVALVLLFLWGGMTASIYSTSLALIADRYSADEMIIANSGYFVMESLGGVGGILMIGFAMQLIGSDGLPYIIMLASILFFSFALTRYPVR